MSDEKNPAESTPDTPEAVAPEAVATESVTEVIPPAPAAETAVLPPAPLYPGQTYPGQTYPGQAAPLQPGQTYPGQTFPGQQSAAGYPATTTWQPPAPKPPLTPQAKRSSLVAGGVGFGLMSLGWSLVSAALVFAFIGAIFALIVRVAQDGNGGGPGTEQFLRSLEQVNAGVFFVPVVVIGIVGLGILIASLFISTAILRRGGIRNAWGVTWAGAGIAIVASWVIGFILSFLAQIIFPLFFATADYSSTTPGDVVGLIIGWMALGVVGTVLLNIAIGIFSWWWMAHALRPREAAAA